jgi:hypothetical protein
MDSELTSTSEQSLVALIVGPADGWLVSLLNALVALRGPSQLRASFSHQRKEKPSPIRSTPEIVQISTWRKFKRNPASTQHCSETLRGLAPTSIGVQDPKDDPRPRQPTQAIGGEIGPARAERRQIPAHGCQPVKCSLDEENLSLTGCAFEAENGLLTRKSQVLDAHCLACGMSAQEPDGLTAAHFGNHNPSREPFTEHSSTFAGLGAAQQPELFCNAQASMLAQVRLERAAIGVAKAASADDPIRQPAVRQVRASAWISP